MYTFGDKDFVLDESGVGQQKKYILKIKDMPESDKPREKLRKFGPQDLLVAELIAIVLSTGTKKEDLMTMAARVVKDYGERSLVNQTNAEKMAQDLEIPLNKAMQIVACAELGRRFFQKKNGSLSVIHTAKDVFAYLHDMQNLPKEHLRGIYLNTHHRIIHDEVISIGTINTNLIHPREVFKPAIEYGAAGIILAHNHPSGVVKASTPDIEITNQLIAAGNLIGIPLLDHIIIGKNKFTSIEANYN